MTKIYQKPEIKKIHMNTRRHFLAGSCTAYYVPVCLGADCNEDDCDNDVA